MFLIAGPLLRIPRVWRDGCRCCRRSSLF